ncbi:MAG TPA: ECF transporter S component [Chloroflexia bacterium]|jgi:energy-coupling factor transport system substrate-specific component
MAQIRTDPDSGYKPEPANTPTTLMVIAGVAFLALFAGWIFLYDWLARTLPGDENIIRGLLSALFWLVVFVVVLVAARASNTVFASWQTRDILLLALVAAAFGPLFVQWQAVYTGFGGFLLQLGVGAGWNDIAQGFWFLPAILVPYIIRRPGAALFAETLAAAVSVLAGSPYGIIGAAVGGLVQGMGAEVIFMLWGWRRYDWLTLSLAGAASAITGFVYYWPIYYAALDATLLAITATAFVIGVLLLAVIPGKLLGDALLATGVLDRFQIGRDRRDRVAASEEF